MAKNIKEKKYNNERILIFEGEFKDGITLIEKNYNEKGEIISTLNIKIA